MFANFTEETCTGTGATLALAGATSGRLRFAESFSDGDPVAYVVEDSGGTILVAGVGTYVAATDSVTRNDTWNWNGSVIDDNPSINITLSGGTHTIRSDIIDQRLPYSEIVQTTYASHLTKSFHNLGAHESGADMSGGYLFMSKGELYSREKISRLNINVTTADAGTPEFRVGIWKIGRDGNAGKLITQADFSSDLATTGMKWITLGTPIILEAGSYYVGSYCDSSTLRVSQIPRSSQTAGKRRTLYNGGAMTFSRTPYAGGAFSDNVTLDVSGQWTYTAMVGWSNA